MEKKDISDQYLEGYSCDVAIRWSRIDPSLLPVDELDKQIICFLRYNARISNAEIAKALNTSEATVRRRINELVRKKIIIGFSALVDLQAVENSIKAYIIIDVDPNKMDDVANSITDNINVLSLYRRRGKNQLIAETLFLNLEAIENFENQISKMSGVKNFETMIISKAYRKNPWIGI
ncbi:Lrp/AsnC family transcriptional regulator [Thermoplasma sp.]|uniref:Lrp/AsnC family transcriptional regulator n=1 Tax=Thermoplasma sp. TaxID=1973142 RepID=UPI00127B708D|nr:Lrp/AsnC family transcriptional regulator [Thermoplasma sp.]KAA8922100.1 MAG: Lrp/AsnC family transcriptional regulator [Thermoplasma sp.]